MPKRINFDTSLGEFAAQYPRSKDVFKKFDLDYCCKGQEKIATAANEKNIDLDVLEFAQQKVILEETPEYEKT